MGRGRAPQAEAARTKAHPWRGMEGAWGPDVGSRSFHSEQLGIVLKCSAGTQWGSQPQHGPVSNMFQKGPLRGTLVTWNEQWWHQGRWQGTQLSQREAQSRQEGSRAPGGGRVAGDGLPWESRARTAPAQELGD